jgi:hypothetical protein
MLLVQHLQHFILGDHEHRGGCDRRSETIISALLYCLTFLAKPAESRNVWASNAPFFLDRPLECLLSAFMDCFYFYSSTRGNLQEALDRREPQQASGEVSR